MKDPYVLENGTLRNLLGITNYRELKKAEKDIGFVKLMTLQDVKYDKLDEKLLKNVHKHIFGDVFDWAGEYRKVPLYKEEIVIPGISLDYANPKEIPSKLKAAIKDMNQCSWKEMNVDEISKEFTKHLAQIWRIHPFRDGNTRTTLAFADIFAKEHGFEMDMGTILNNLGRIQNRETGKIVRYSVRDKFVLAALDPNDYPEPKYLESVIKESIEKGKQKNIENPPNEEIER